MDWIDEVFQADNLRTLITGKAKDAVARYIDDEYLCLIAWEHDDEVFDTLVDGSESLINEDVDRSGTEMALIVLDARNRDNELLAISANVTSEWVIGDVDHCMSGSIRSRTGRVEFAAGFTAPDVRSLRLRSGRIIELSDNDRRDNAFVVRIPDNDALVNTRRESFLENINRTL